MRQMIQGYIYVAKGCDACHATFSISADVHLDRKPAVIPIPEQGPSEAPPTQPTERIQYNHVFPVGYVGCYEARGVDKSAVLMGLFDRGAWESATFPVEIGGDG